MTDVVYVVRDGENPELRYSMRSLQNVNHDNVWVIGGSPSWLNHDFVEHIPRIRGGSAYRTTREHIRAACNTRQISDPFMLWNDDFFAMRWVGDVPLYHRGPLVEMLAEFKTVKTPWANGLRATAGAIQRSETYTGSEHLSYDAHLPLIVHKDEMMHALRDASKLNIDAVHTRTLYGNRIGGGVYHPDPKMMSRSQAFPRGAWLSSSSNTFPGMIEPVLRYIFPDPSIYESEFHD